MKEYDLSHLGNPTGLTPKEKEIWEKLDQNLSPDTISEQLNITKTTLKTHKHRIQQMHRSEGIRSNLIEQQTVMELAALKKRGKLSYQDIQREYSLPTLDQARTTIANHPYFNALYRKYCEMGKHDLDSAEDMAQYDNLDIVFNVAMVGRGIFFGGITQPDIGFMKKRRFNPNTDRSVLRTNEVGFVNLNKFNIVQVVQPGVEIYSLDHNGFILAKRAGVIPIYV